MLNFRKFTKHLPPDQQLTTEGAFEVYGKSGDDRRWSHATCSPRRCEHLQRGDVDQCSVHLEYSIQTAEAGQHTIDTFKAAAMGRTRV